MKPVAIGTRGGAVAALPAAGVLISGLVAALFTGCGSGDSTASKTPGPTATSVQSPSPQASGAPGASGASGPEGASGLEPAPGASGDPCATNLAAPEIARAVSDLPPDPRSRQGWNPEPLAGNYNECALLSVAIVKANTNSENPNTRALLFHRGKFIPTGVPDTYGFNGLDTAETTGDTVALEYSSGVRGLDSVVKFRWNGSGVELIGNTGG